MCDSHVLLQLLPVVTVKLQRINAPAVTQRTTSNTQTTTATTLTTMRANKQKTIKRNLFLENIAIKCIKLIVVDKIIFVQIYGEDNINACAYLHHICI